MYPLFLESIGTSELLVILVVALIIFGPRKLPQLSRSLGKSLGEFKRASEDFKKTWEREVAMENLEKDSRTTMPAMLPEDNSILGTSVARGEAVHQAAEEQTISDAPPSVAATQASTSSNAPALPTVTPVNEPPRKQDWL